MGCVFFGIALLHALRAAHALLVALKAWALELTYLLTYDKLCNLLTPPPPLIPLNELTTLHPLARPAPGVGPLCRRLRGFDPPPLLAAHVVQWSNYARSGPSTPPLKPRSASTPRNARSRRGTTCCRPAAPPRSAAPDVETWTEAAARRRMLATGAVPGDYLLPRRRGPLLPRRWRGDVETWTAARA